MKKRLIAFMMAMVIITTMFPFTTFADERDEGYTKTVFCTGTIEQGEDIEYEETGEEPEFQISDVNDAGVALYLFKLIGEGAISGIGSWAMGKMMNAIFPNASSEESGALQQLEAKLDLILKNEADIKAGIQKILDLQYQTTYCTMLNDYLQTQAANCAVAISTYNALMAVDKDVEEGILTPEEAAGERIQILTDGLGIHGEDNMSINSAIDRQYIALQTLYSTRRQVNVMVEGGGTVVKDLYITDVYRELLRYVFPFEEQAYDLMESFNEYVASYFQILMFIEYSSLQARYQRCEEHNKKYPDDKWSTYNLVTRLQSFSLDSGSASAAYIEGLITKHDGHYYWRPNYNFVISKVDFISADVLKEPLAVRRNYDMPDAGDKFKNARGLRLEKRIEDPYIVSSMWDDLYDGTALITTKQIQGLLGINEDETLYQILSGGAGINILKDAPEFAGFLINRNDADNGLCIESEISKRMTFTQYGSHIPNVRYAQKDIRKNFAAGEASRYTPFRYYALSNYDEFGAHLYTTYNIFDISPEKNKPTFCRLYISKVPQPCTHEHVVRINGRYATCSRDGYTGDLFCTDCQKIVKLGEYITERPPHEAAKDRWYSTPEGHYSVCSYCGIRMEDHFYEHELEEGICKFCYYPHSQEVVSQQYDDTQHWMECSKCGDKFWFGNHILKDNRDEESHWRECEICGVQLEKEAHDFVNKICRKCGYKKGDHRHDDVTYSQKDSTFHTLHCNVCGVTVDEYHDMEVQWIGGNMYLICSKCGFRELQGPKNPKRKDVIDTGDSSNPAGWIALMAIMTAVITGALIYRKKHN